MITVLSLFDGISTVAHALQRLEISCVIYACEVDRAAIAVSNRHFPAIKQLGDVRRVRGSDLPPIDLLVGGFPCPDFSRLGSGKGLAGKTGNLFFEMERLYRECRPRWFLGENVVMAVDKRETICNWLRLPRHTIDAQLFGPQRRKRYFWTDLDVPPLPLKSDLVLGDVVEHGIKGYDVADRKPQLRPSLVDALEKVPSGQNWRWFRDNYPEHPEWGYLEKIIRRQAERGAGGGVSRALEVVGMAQKSPCLLASGPGSFGMPQDFTRFVFRDLGTGALRFPTPLEFERLQGLPDGYTAGVGLSDQERYRLIGNAFDERVIEHILSGTKQCRSNTKATSDEPAVGMLIVN